MGIRGGHTPGPEPQPLPALDPTLARVLNREFSGLFQDLLRRNTPAAIRLSGAFERNLRLLVAAALLRVIGEWEDPLPPSEETCAGIVRRLTTTEFYRCLRRESRKHLLAETHLAAGRSTGRKARALILPITAGIAGEKGGMAARAAFRRWRASLSSAEQSVLDFCSRREFWLPSGRINFSLVSRATGLDRGRVRQIHEDLVNRMRRELEGSET